MTEYLLVVLSGSFLASAAATWVWIAVARRYQIIDQPNARGAHDHATPRGGGVAIVLISILGFLVFYYWKLVTLTPLFFILPLGGLAVGLLGVLDDLYSLRARTRFLVQVIIAGAAVYWLPELPELPLIGLVDWPSWLVFGFAVLSVVWSINLFNFMDGINGRQHC